MKIKHLFGILALLAIVSTIIAFIAGMMGLGSGMLGCALAMAMVPGGLGADPIIDAEPSHDLNLTDINRMLCMVQPDKYPLDQLLRSLSSEEAKSRVIEWGTIDLMDSPVSVSAAYTTGGVTGGTATITLDDASRVLPNNILSVPSINTTADGYAGTELMLQVVSVSGNDIVVYALNGVAGTTTGLTVVPSIAAGTLLYFMANSVHIIDSMVEYYLDEPTDEYNYVQTFMGIVSEAIQQKLINTKYDYDITNLKANELYKFRARANRTFAWGVRSKRTIGNKQYYAMGGINQFIVPENRLSYVKNSTSDLVGLTKNRMVEIGRQLFANTNGSETRLAICGDNALADLLKIADWQKQVSEKETVIKWGITFNEIETGFGRVLLKLDPSFRQCGHENDILFIDPANVTRKVLEDTQWTNLKLDESGNGRVDAKRLLESTSLEVRNAPCHMLLRGINT